MSENDFEIAGSSKNTSNEAKNKKLSPLNLEEALAILDLQEKYFNKFSDCEIHVKHEVFKTSRYLLSIHSEVFRAYFQNNSIERQTGVIRIDDLDANLIREALRFMYSGRIQNLNSICYELYVIADRYDIKLLKSKCLTAMFDNLSLKTIFKCLELAYQLDVPEFKQKVFDFTVKNYNQIEKSEQMKDLIRTNDTVSLLFFSDLVKELRERGKKLEQIEDQNAEVTLNIAPLVAELDQAGHSLVRNAANRYQSQLDDLQERLQTQLNEEIIRNVTRLRAQNSSRGRGRGQNRLSSPEFDDERAITDYYLDLVGRGESTIIFENVRGNRGRNDAANRNGRNLRFGGLRGRGGYD